MGSEKRDKVLNPRRDFGAVEQSQLLLSKTTRLFKHKTKSKRRQKEVVSRTIYSILSISRPFKEVVWGLRELLENSVYGLMLIHHP